MNLLLSSYLCFISFFNLDLYLLGDDTSISQGSFTQTKHHLSWSTSKIRVQLAPSNMCGHSSNFLLTILRRCFFCWSFFAICVSCLRRGWPLLCVMFFLVFVTSHMEISFNWTNKFILNQISSQAIYTECIFPSLSMGPVDFRCNGCWMVFSSLFNF